MRESRTPGSVRGAGGNSRPYRDSRDSGVVPSADTFQIVEGNIARPLMRGHGGLGAVEDPGMCGRSLYGNREILGLAGEAPPVRTGKARSRSR